MKIFLQQELTELQKWNNEWLITFDKIEAGRYVANSLGVPFIGFLYLIPDDLGLSESSVYNRAWAMGIKKDPVYLRSTQYPPGVSLIFAIETTFLYSAYNKSIFKK